MKLVTHTVLIRRPIEHVFGVLTDFAGEPQWQPEVISCTPLSMPIFGNRVAVEDPRLVLYRMSYFSWRAVLVRHAEQVSCDPFNCETKREVS